MMKISEKVARRMGENNIITNLEDYIIEIINWLVSDKYLQYEKTNRTLREQNEVRQIILWWGSGGSF